MVKPAILRSIYGKIEDIWRANGLISGRSGRHMKYPYTFCAKIAQFPVFFYIKHNWIWMYYPLGALGGLYAFAKIHALSNSEENKRSWAESQRKSAEKEAHH